jgi:hypothetical protein
MVKKTSENFFRQLNEDDDFRDFIGRMSPEKLGKWLLAEFGRDLDMAAFTTNLWMTFPEKQYQEILRVRAAMEGYDLSDPPSDLPRSQPLAATAQDRAQAVSQLAAMLDRNAALRIIRFYNRGLSQIVQVPTSSGSMREITLERGTQPKVSELKFGVRKRLARLMVEAAEKHGVKSVWVV